MPRELPVAFVELRPQFPEPYFIRATIRNMKGDDAGAVEDARRSIKMGAKEPQLAEIHKLLKSKNAKP